MTMGVAVPVFRGQHVLHRCLDALPAAAEGLREAPVVVLAVNDGKADSWQAASAGAQQLRREGLAARAIRTPPGRSTALNAAERHLPSGPRVVLDQDAVLSRGALALLEQVLAPARGESQVHFAAPLLRWAPTTSPLVRRYLAAWRATPYVRDSPVTCGVYAVSEDGRRRWREYPAIHSDDKYVRLHFPPHERAIVTGCSYEVLPPADWRELVRARQRYRRGNQELERLLAQGRLPPDLPRHAGALRVWSQQPRLWSGATTVLAVHALAARPFGGR